MIAVRNRPEELGQHPDGMTPEAVRVAMSHGKSKPIKTLPLTCQLAFQRCPENQDNLVQHNRDIVYFFPVADCTDADTGPFNRQGIFTF